MRVAHLSDTQIRNFKRHKEFRDSYANLYKSLREKEPHLIVVVGDIAHTKTQISPEFVKLCSEYFVNLANIAPTVVVPGNHDGNLNNLSRMDALTPIVDALEHKNLHYYKHSGVYDVMTQEGHVQIVNFSCFDEEWPTKNDLRLGLKVGDKEAPKIGLYHGFVQGAILQNGMQIYEDANKVENFLEIVDFLMLGDIHRMQILDHEYRSAYCGSYPQQNYGESVEKGYLLWDIRSKDDHDVDFMPLPNVCPYYTIELKDDLKLEKYDFQKGGRIRVFSRQLTMIEKDDLKEKLQELYEPVELKFIDDVSAARQEVQIKMFPTILERLSEVAVQERFIKAFLESYDLKADVFADILNINKKYDALAKKQDSVTRNVEYKIGKIWWDNICSFGEDNEFDFTKHKGILGVFGRNGVGKSTFVVDVPNYCLQNKVSKRVTKNDLIINENKDFCLAGMEIHSPDKTYRIERNTTVYVKSGKRKGKPIVQGKTDVDFKIITGQDEESKNGEERGVTDAEIRRIFGTYDDLIATSIAPQWQLLDFIDKGGTERQKLIGRYFDIDIFDQKHKLAKEDIKAVKANLRMLADKNLDEDIDEKNKLLKEIKSKVRAAKKNQKESEAKIESLNAQMEAINAQIKSVDLPEGVTEETLDREIATAEGGVIDQISKIENLEYDIDKVKGKIKKLKHAMSMVDIAYNKQIVQDFEENEKDKAVVLADKKKSFSALEGCIVRLDELNKYKCISNPDCCMLEEVEKAKAAKAQQEADYQGLSELASKLLSKTFDVEKAKKQIQLYDKAQKQVILEEEPTLASLQNELEYAKEILGSKKERVERLKADKEKYLKNKEQVEENARLRQQHVELAAERDQFRSYSKGFLKEVVNLSSEEGSVRAILKEHKRERDELEELRKQYEAYDYFIQAMGKDGIPRLIIRDNLSIINKQIKRILSNGVGFNVELDSSDSGKEIEIFFKSPKSPRRSIELCSGMEKTMAAIAIRAALVSVTTLPRFNIFVLDEVFSALDPEYMDSVTRILDYLKQLFDTVVIITHIDSLKDVVDHVVEVERDDQGYARLT